MPKLLYAGFIFLAAFIAKEKIDAVSTFSA
jgi:hypothetical protein